MKRDSFPLPCCGQPLQHCCSYLLSQARDPSPGKWELSSVFFCSVLGLSVDIANWCQFELRPSFYVSDAFHRLNVWMDWNRFSWFRGCFTVAANYKWVFLTIKGVAEGKRLHFITLLSVKASKYVYIYILGMSGHLHLNQTCIFNSHMAPVCLCSRDSQLLSFLAWLGTHCAFWIWYNLSDAFLWPDCRIGWYVTA